MNTTAAILTIGSVILLGVYWCASIAYTLHSLVGSIRREWREIDCAMDERAVLIERLCRDAAALFPRDPIIGRWVSDLRRDDGPARSPAQKLREALAKGTAVRGIIAQIRTYPALFQAPDAIRLGQAIDAIDEIIALRAKSQDSAALRFNARRHDFASEWIARAWTESDLPTVGTLSAPRIGIVLAAGEEA